MWPGRPQFPLLLSISSAQNVMLNGCQTCHHLLCWGCFYYDFPHSKIQRPDDLPAGARLARTRPPSLRGGVRGADWPLWKTVRGPVVMCGCPSPCPSNFTLGTCPGDTWATDGHENSGPAPPSKVLAPWPLASSRQHPYSGTRKGRSREAESSTRRQAALVFRGLWVKHVKLFWTHVLSYTHCVVLTTLILFSSFFTLYF